MFLGDIFFVIVSVFISTHHFHLNFIVPTFGYIYSVTKSRH
jgi:hypothetical protein